ncbi:hypothetical protein [Adhaeretor mobilis]|uniref:Uncharacterized protein n=1 Tax=Adhaeretor mobilis TaxID=1930276 RepID=A0A517MVV9_9BACT|nr:hypothetical protein [Adhaeretor mobilis]QDS98927.1 hypothetical protein HG15A2_22150 [Adhaeretor mobilis]
MDTAALLMMISSVGATCGWQPMPDGSAGYEVIVQVTESQLADGTGAVDLDLPEEIAPIGRVRYVTQSGKAQGDTLPRIRTMTALKPLLPAKLAAVEDDDYPKLSRDGIKLTQYNGPVAGTAAGSRYGTTSTGVQSYQPQDASFDPYAKPQAIPSRVAEPSQRNPFPTQESLSQQARNASSGLTQYTDEQLRQLQQQAAAGVDNTVRDAHQSVNDTFRSTQNSLPNVQAADLFGGSQQSGQQRVGDRLRTAAENLSTGTQQLFDHLGRPIRRLTGKEQSQAQSSNQFRSLQGEPQYPARQSPAAQQATPPVAQQYDPRLAETYRDQATEAAPRTLAQRDANGFRAVRSERHDQPIDPQDAGRLALRDTDPRYSNTDFRDQPRTQSPQTQASRTQPNGWNNVADNRSWPSDRTAQNPKRTDDRGNFDGWPQYDLADPNDLANRNSETDSRFTDTSAPRSTTDPWANSGQTSSGAIDPWSEKPQGPAPELRKDMYAGNNGQAERDPFAIPSNVGGQAPPAYDQSGSQPGDINRNVGYNGQVDPRQQQGFDPEEKKDLFSLILSWVLLSGSIAGNLYLFWSYLDVRSKYSNLVHQSGRVLGRHFSPV